jgi:hypothetical protein
MPNQKLWKFLIGPTSAHAQMSEERRDHASAIVPKPLRAIVGDRSASLKGGGFMQLSPAFANYGI